MTKLNRKAMSKEHIIAATFRSCALEDPMTSRSWRHGVLALLLAAAVAAPQAGQRPGGGGEETPPTPLATPVAKADARMFKLKEAARRRRAVDV